mmetsp:Transcript_25062/g.37031  ORF Transcript_25062/g.37031 Transcript_25062/m.37031 type:complete len:101 (+) Transcript_25062:1828-2130(+)
MLWYSFLMKLKMPLIILVRMTHILLHLCSINILMGFMPIRNMSDSKAGIANNIISITLHLLDLHHHPLLSIMIRRAGEKFQSKCPIFVCEAQMASKPKQA